MFGGVAAASFTVNSSTQITAVSLAQPAQAVDVQVTTPSGTSAISSADLFTYAAAPLPVVSSLSTTSGSTAGGTTVVITGTDLGGATDVWFGGYQAASFTVNSGTQITAVTPPNFVGTFDVVVVTTAGGSLPSSASRFTFTAAAVPAITGLGTTSGSTEGGTTVVITGSNFTGASAVRFGGVDAVFTVDSATQITAVTPPQAAGAVNVTVLSPTGNSAASSSSQFTYAAAPAPAVSSLGTTGGSTAGGTTVVLTGSTFTAASQVLFGSVAAASFTVDSATQITAVSPPQSAAVVDVTVTTPSGTSSTSSSDQFTYTAEPAPAVSGISPSSGNTAGGTVVTISGSHFTSATDVTFGGTSAASFTVLSDTAILATAPAGTAGTVDVQVVTPSGTSSAVAGDQFTYTAVTAPTITSLSITSGTTGGWQSMTITGTGFLAATGVSFGGVPAGFTVQSDTSLLVTTPPQTAGTVNVVVSVPGASSAPARFKYIAAPPPAVTSLDTTTGSAAGGTVVTISGSGFLGATGVTFGGNSATFTVLSDTAIQAVAPAVATSGVVGVRVATPTGTSAASSADWFTYTSTSPPSLTWLSLTSGLTTGGDTIDLSGSGFTGATAVSFGTQAAAFTVRGDGWITATVPAGAAGTVSVTVTTPGGTSSGQSYTYSAPAPPAVDWIGQATGATTGGDTITLMGSGFTAATAVTFGTVAASSFTVLSDYSLTAVVPAGAVGTVDITVTTAAGTSPTSSADQYVYTAPGGPAVLGLSTSSGPGSGGTTVFVSGTHLTGATAVLFGGVPAAYFVVNGDGQLTAVAPAEAAGTVDVTVTTPAGTSPTSSYDQYTFTAVPAPKVASVWPASGPAAGGNRVTVAGSGFLGATRVQFGTADALSFQVINDTHLYAVAPAGTGTVNVQVTTAAGTSAVVLWGRYRYGAGPTITSISATGDKATGGTLLTITGTDLDGATGAYFGDGDSSDLISASSTSLLVRVPPDDPGTVDLTVYAPGGFSDTLSFTYSAAHTVTWVGGTGDWGTASGWDSGSVPGSGDDVVIPAGGTVTYSGTGGPVHGLSVAGSLELSGSLTVSAAVAVSAGSLTIDTGAALSAANFTQSGGTTTGNGSLSVSGTVRVDGGSMSVVGSSTTLAAGAFHQTGGSFLDKFRPLAVSHDFSVEGGTATVQNSGGTISGQMLLTGGTLTLDNVYTLTVTGGVQVGTTGYLELVAGTLTADVTNAGHIRMGWSPMSSGYTINGNFTQTAFGVLSLEASPDEYDHLSVTGTAALDGAFELIAVGGFSPGTGTSLGLLSYGSRQGTFASYSLPGTSSGSWDYRYDDPAYPDAFSLWVV
jgi:hypothetical protein